MSLYDETIKLKSELQTLIDSINQDQEPLLTINVRTEQAEQNDIHNSSQQNVNAEIETGEQSEVPEVCFPCPHCPYDAATSDSLNDHLLTHSGDKNFNMIKTELLTEPEFLNDSMKQEPPIITINVRTKPEENDFHGIGSASYQQNVNTEIEMDEQPEVCFPCPHCPYDAETSDSLKIHLLTHDIHNSSQTLIDSMNQDQEPLLTINVRTEQAEQNDIHNSSHLQEQNVKAVIETDEQSEVPEVCFPCPHCSYYAATSDSLKYHIITHTGEKNFMCGICKKRFNQSCNLKRHISTVHEKIRPFACPHCPYKAAESGHLKEHILKHTGENNFECHMCEKKLSRHRDLTQHIRTVHDKIKPFPCPHCPYKSGGRGTLKNHIIRKHTYPIYTPYP